MHQHPALAVAIPLLCVASILHLLRALLDLLRPRVVSRASTFWASIGLGCYLAAFVATAATAIDDTDSGSVNGKTARNVLTIAALWACKVSVASLYPQLGLRLLVVSALAAYLAASFVAALVARLVICRQWAGSEDSSCGRDVRDVAVYTALHVGGYIILMSIPMFIYHALTHRALVFLLLLLSTGTVVLSVLTGVSMTRGQHRRATILSDAELCLALIITSLPSLYLHVFSPLLPPLPVETQPSSNLHIPPSSPAGGAEERELVNFSFNPRTLGVLPDSIHAGSFRSGSSTPADDEEGGRGVRQLHLQEVGGGRVREEVWEQHAHAPPASPRSLGWEEDGQASPRSMGGS